MKKHAILVFLSANTAMSAIAQGINFETGDWKSVVAKARQANKLIYVDVYTTWCGPCKRLEKDIFPRQEVGDKFNRQFINYRIDAEKGEGISLAKKYSVMGYPTNLFVDPKTEALVYISVGAAADVTAFNATADVAVKEQNDPMTWDKYTARHKAGKKDKQFLKAYLKKAALLKKNNDAILDDYVAAVKGKVTDSDIIFIAEMMQTADNQAIALVDAHKELIKAQQPEYAGYYNQVFNGWIYATYKKAVAEKNIGLLTVLDNARTRYLGKTKDAESYAYRTRYHTAVGADEDAFTAGIQEAAYLAEKTDAEYTKEDADAITDAKDQLRAQLKATGVPDDKMEEAIQENLGSDPAILHAISMEAATKLNNISWQVYEKHGSDPVLMKSALGWSDRSLQLAAGLSDWSLFADTYAHLLYASGDKTEAIALEEDAINKAKAAKIEDISSLEDSLKKMKDGTL